MFPAYPGFEELTIRVELKDSARTVIARLEEWPASRRAVVVCAYEDDLEAGEWLLVNHQGEPLCVDHAQAIKEGLSKRAADPTATTKRLRGLICNIERALAPINSVVGKQMSIVRVCHLPDLPAEPRLALCDYERCSWHSRWDMEHKIGFEFEGVAPLQRQQELRAALQREWANEESDARFAWQWAQWKDAERHQRLLGEVGDYEEVSRIMRWVLITREFTEAESCGFAWRLMPFLESAGNIFINFKSGFGMFGTQDSDKAIQLWHNWLVAHFAPHKRQDWMEQHPCAREHWHQHGLPLGTARLDSPPTAHEQLEAQLALRDWLRDKATPQQANELLASLDS